MSFILDVLSVGVLLDSVVLLEGLSVGVFVEVLLEGVSAGVLLDWDHQQVARDVASHHGASRDDCFDG